MCGLAAPPDLPRLAGPPALRETVRGRTEVAEKDCGEVGAGEKVRDKMGLIETEV